MLQCDWLDHPGVCRFLEHARKRGGAGGYLSALCNVTPFSIVLRVYLQGWVSWLCVCFFFVLLARASVGSVAVHVERSFAWRTFECAARRGYMEAHDTSVMRGGGVTRLVQDARQIWSFFFHLFPRPHHIYDDGMRGGGSMCPTGSLKALFLAIDTAIDKKTRATR